MSEQRTISGPFPDDGIHIAASPGNAFTRVHLDLAQDGVTLAMVGAASSAISEGNRHVIHLTKADDGITLAMVGAASAAARPE